MNETTTEPTTEQSSELDDLSHWYHRCSKEQLVARCGHLRKGPLWKFPSRQQCVVCLDLIAAGVCAACQMGSDA